MYPQSKSSSAGLENFGEVDESDSDPGYAVLSWRMQ